MGLFKRKITDEQMNTVKRLLKEANDHSAAANQSVTPGAFFRNYHQMEKKMEELTDYEKYGIFKGNLPSKDLFRMQSNMQNEVSIMIQRSYYHLTEKMQKMDEAEKKRARDKFFRDMEEYAEEMNSYNRGVLRELRERYGEARQEEEAE